jgi:hypothetical protein
VTRKTVATALCRRVPSGNTPRHSGAATVRGEIVGRPLRLPEPIMQQAMRLPYKDRRGTAHRAVATRTRFLSAPLEAGLGQIDVVLDAAQDFVVDGLFVAQGDDGVAFGIQGFAGQLLEVL